MDRGHGGRRSHSSAGNLSDALQAKVNVYGYLMATVNPDGQKDGTIRFEFQQLEKQSVPPAVKAGFAPTFVDWCFDKNFQADDEPAMLKSMEKRASLGRRNKPAS